jgi:hypothetical protein
VGAPSRDGPEVAVTVGILGGIALVVVILVAIALIVAFVWLTS